MAIIGLILGSVVGFFAAIVGWLVIGLPFTSALAIYLVTSFGFGALTMIAASIDSAEASPQPRPIRT